MGAAARHPALSADAVYTSTIRDLETHMRPVVTPFRHEPTGTFSYVVHPPGGRDALIIDPVVDYDASSGELSTGSADALLAHVRDQALTVHWVLETHAHADHLAGGHYIRDALSAKLGIGEGIREVQSTFRSIFNLEEGFAMDGSQFDHLFVDGETATAGELEFSVMNTPGHTNDSVTYQVGDAAFVGDSIFMPDSGTARCDFPGGDASLLYDSIQKLFALPEETRLFMCHDYGAGGERAPECQTTVAAQRADNIHVGGGKTREEFVRMRHERDATLAMPKLIYPSVQYNIRGGQVPPEESNGSRYFKIPLKGHLE